MRRSTSNALSRRARSAVSKAPLVVSVTASHMLVEGNVLVVMGLIDDLQDLPKD